MLLTFIGMFNKEMQKTRKDRQYYLRKKQIFQINVYGS